MDKIKQVESYLDENCVKLECLVFNQTMKDTEQYIFKFLGLGRLVKSIKPKNGIEQYLSKLSGLGRIVCSNYVFTVTGKSNHMLGIPSDSDHCFISAICVLPGGEILVLDMENNNVKLLDQQYQVVSHCDVAAGSMDMCLITSSEVALTVEDYFTNTHEVQFITVTPLQLVTGRKIQLQHSCSGIAHHHGDLFITSGTALYKHSLSGKEISKLYEAKAGHSLGSKCAVSPTGDKLYMYITHKFDHKLLTLAWDGTVLAIFNELGYPLALHVTPAGQVLVCYGTTWGSHIQVHTEGKKMLATLAILKDNIKSVCYNRTTLSVIVGGNNGILVLKIQ